MNTTNSTLSFSAQSLRRVLIFTAVLVTSLANVAQADAATRRYYCKMTKGWWTADGAAIGAYAWESSNLSSKNANWPGVRMTGTENTGEWYIDLDTKYDRVIFVRVNGSGNIADWGAQTNDQWLGDNNYCTITNSDGCWSGSDCKCSTEWTKYAPAPAISGSMNSWRPDDNVFSGTSGSVTCSVTLSANSKYEFKVVTGTDWYGYGSNTGELTYVGQSGTTTLSTSGQNICLATAGAGTYTFTWDCTSHTLSVAYPTVTHPSSDYVYFNNSGEWANVKAHVFTGGTSINHWPGPELSSFNFDGTNYYYTALGDKTSVIFSKSGDESTKTGDLTTASSNKGKYYDYSSSTWKDFTATLTLSTDQGETTNPSPTSVTVTYGASTNINTDVLSTSPAKTGYTFAGYYTAAGGSGTQVIGSDEKIPSNLTGYTSFGNWIKTGSSVSATLYAKWTCYITLKKYDGSGNHGSVAATYNSADNITRVTPPTRDGYVFCGYYTQAYGSGTRLIDGDGNFGTNIASYIDSDGKWIYSGGDINVYAYWKKASSAGKYTFRYYEEHKVAYEVESFAGDGNERTISNFTIPTQVVNTPLFYVGYNEDFVSSGLGEGGTKTSSAEMNWTTAYAETDGVGNGAMKLLPGSSAVGLASGAVGTLKIWTNDKHKNLSVGFLPNGYGLTTADGTYAFTIGDGYFCYTNPITISSTEAAGNFQVKLATSDSYAACAQGTSEAASAVNGRKISGDADIANGKKGVFQMWADATANNFGLRFVTVYDVSFDLQGHGEAIDDYEDVRYNDLIGAPSAPSATGYTFGGWYKDDDCTDEWDFESDVITEATTLYAKWTANTYTLTLNANGGSDGTESVTATYNSSSLSSSITNPTKTGYTFGGWYSGSGGTGNLVINTSGVLQASVSGYTGAGGIWTATEAKTLYAKWTANTYTITYKDFGGEDFSGVHGDGYPTSHTYGLATALVSPTREGYAFLGWFTNSACTTSAGSSLGATAYTDNITLYALWGKTVSQNDYYKLYSTTNDEAATIIANAVFPDYITTTFNNKYWWNGIQACTIDVPHDFTGINTGGNRAYIYPNGSNNTFTLKAVKNVKAVRFYGWNNGTGKTISTTASLSMGSGDVPTFSAVAIASENGVVAEHIIYISTTDGSTARTNYDADTYYDLTFTFSGGSVVGMYVETNEKVTLTYSANGGSDAPSAESWAPNETKHLSSTLPTRDGYVFKEWNTSSTGNGDSYRAGAAYTMPSVDTTLYAKWSEITHTVTVAAGANGTVSPTSLTGVGISTASAEATATPSTGYSFSSWTLPSGTSAADGYSSTSNPISINATADSKTITANFSANNYTITLNLNGGDAGSESVTATYNSSSLSISTLATKSGYELLGYTTVAGGGTMVIDASGDLIASVTGYTDASSNWTKADAVTLYALWGKTISQNNFYQLYSIEDAGGAGSDTDEKKAARAAALITAASFPAHISTTLNYAYHYGNGQWEANSIVVPHDFATYMTSGCNSRSYLAVNGGDKTVTLKAVKNVKAVRFYGWNNSNGKTIQTAAALASGSGSVPTYSNVAITNANMTVAEYIVRLDTATNYDEEAYYNLTFTLTGGSWVGMYVETNETLTLSYNGNGSDGGTVPSDDTRAPGGIELLSSSVPTRTGYTFGGWNEKADGSGATTYAAGAAYTMPTTATTLYATWVTPIGQDAFYQLYNSSDKSTSELITAAGFPSYITANITKTRGEWGSYTTPTIDVPHDFTKMSGTQYFIMPNDNDYFKLNDVSNVKAVHFYGWDDTAHEITTTATVKNGVGSAPTYSAVNVVAENGVARDYCVLLDTATNYTSAALYDFTFTFDGGSVVGIYVETRDTYTLTYDANDGSGAPSAETWTCNDTKHISSTVPTRSGYAFKEWNTAANGSGRSYHANDTLNLAANTTLHAIWVEPIAQNDFYPLYSKTEKTYSQLLSVLPSHITSTIDDQYWYGNLKSTTIDVPHNFKDSISNGTYYSFLKVASGKTITITGANIKAVRFYGWNGSSTGTLSTTASVVCGVGTAPTYSSVTTSGTNIVVAEHTVDIAGAANYNANTLYTFTFTFSGGSWLGMYVETNDTRTLTYSAADADDNVPDAEDWAPNATDHLSSTVPTRTGYTFAGWNTLSTGLGENYDAGAVYTMPLTNTTLYAKWTVNSYTVEEHNNGGRIWADSIGSYTYGVGAILPTNVTKWGYDFDGWYDNEELDGDPVTAIGTSETGNKDYYAKWSSITQNYPIASHPEFLAAQEGDIIAVTVTGVHTSAAIYLYDLNYTEITHLSISAAGTYTFQLSSAAATGIRTYGLLVSGTNFTFSDVDIRYRKTLWTGTLSDNSGWKEVAVDKSIFSGLSGGDFLGLNISAINDGESWHQYAMRADYDAVLSSMPTETGIGIHKLSAADVVALRDSDRIDITAQYLDISNLYSYTRTRVYTVTLTTNGGTINAGNVTSYTFGTGATLPTNVTKTGYTFAGWYPDEDFEESRVYSISTTDYGDKTYYAKWTANDYTVTLNTNSGTINSGNVTSYTYGEGATLPTDVTKDNYRFDGWYDNEELDGDPVTEIADDATDDKEYWAKWTDIKQEFSKKGSLPIIIVGEGDLVVVEVSAYGESASIVLKDKTGTTFASQSISATGRYAFPLTSAQATALHDSLIVTGTNYTGEVSLLYRKQIWSGTLSDTEGWTASSQIASSLFSDMEEGSFVGIKVSSIKTGGWYQCGLYAGNHQVFVKEVDAAGTYIGVVTAADVDSLQNKYVCLGAQYLVIAKLYTYVSNKYYTISYYEQDGTTPIVGLSPDSYTYGVGATLATPDARTCYTFEGWHKSTISGDKKTKIDNDAYGNYTFVGEWSLNSHTLTWNFNGGSSSDTEGEDYTEAGDVDCGDDLTYPSGSSMTKTGYTFSSWSSDATEMPDEDLTITASWTANNYTVTLDPDNGNSTVAVSATYAAAMPSKLSDGETDLAAPTFSGYTFGGYYDDHLGAGTQYYDGDAVSATSWNKASTATLYAKWTQTVTLNMQGIGSNQSPTVLYKGTALSGYTAPTNIRSGALLGFYTASSEGTKVLNANGTFAASNVTDYITSDTWTKTGATTLYAQWDPVISLPDTLRKSNYVHYGGGLRFSGDTLDYSHGDNNHRDGYAEWKVDIEKYVYNVTISGRYPNGHNWKLYLVSGSDTLSTCDLGSKDNTGLGTETKLWNLSGLTSAGVYTIVAKNIRNWGEPRLLYVAMDPVTVTYDANGGTCGTASAYYTGSAMTLPSATKSGYVFEGWYSGGTKIGNAGGSYEPTASITLTAKWGIITALPDTLTKENVGDYSSDMTWYGDDNEYFDYGPTDAANLGRWAKWEVSVVPCKYNIAWVSDYNVSEAIKWGLILFDGPDTVATYIPASTTWSKKEYTYPTQWDLTKDKSGEDLVAGTYTLEVKNMQSYARPKLKSLVISPNLYTITYDKGTYGTGEIAAGKKIGCHDFTLSSSTFTRAGYEQDGWATSDGGDKTYNLGATYSTDEALTLYPHWTCATPPDPTAFTAGSITDGGVTFTIEDDADAASYEIYYSTDDDEPDGETEATTTADSKTKEVTGLTAATTYYAWVRAVCDGSHKSAWVALDETSFFTNYTITMGTVTTNQPEGSTVGGTISASPSSAAAGDEVTLTATPTSGYGFVSWTIEKTSDNSDITASVLDGNTLTMPAYGVTVKATFAKQYNIAFKMADRTTSVPGIELSSYLYGIGVPEMPTPPDSTGYTFDAWYLEWCVFSKGGSGDGWVDGCVIESIGTSDHGSATYLAKYDPNPYTITLNNQSATSAGTESISVTFDANTNLTSAITSPTKTCYAFGGYYTETAGGGSQIIDADGNVNASVDGYTDEDTNWKHAGNVTLYAKWTQVNLAYQKTAVAGYEPSNGNEHSDKVTDGTNDAWVTWADQPTAKEYVYIDLGAFYQLSSIEVDWGVDYSTDYILQACQNAPADSASASKDYNWFTLAEVTDAAANSTKTTAVSGPARYVRLHSLSKSNVQCIRVREIRVYGTGTATTYTTPTLSTAEVASYPSGYRTVQLHLVATDSHDEAIHTYRITDESGNISVVTTDEDDLVTISGLSHNVRHTLTVQAMDPGALLSASEDIPVLIWDPTANLALGKTVVAGYEDTNPDEVAAKVTDGNLSTKWIAYGVGTVEREWIYVDLGAYYQVSTIAVFWEPGRYMSQFEIQVAQQLPETASDDTQWFLVSTESHTYTNDELGNTEGKEKSYTVNAPARYVRLRSKEHVDCASIYEFRVFGSGFATADANVPEITSATVSYNNDGKAYLTLTATDTEDGTTNWFRIYNPKTETYSLQQTDGDDQIVITGLDDCTDYTFEVQAMDSAAQLSAVSEILVNVPVIKGTNLALGKTATAGIKQGGYVASNAVDGNTGTMWSGNANSSDDPPGRIDGTNQWLNVDLGKNYDIDSIKIMWGGNSGTWPQDYEIQVSYNSSDYTTIVHRGEKDDAQTQKYLDLDAKGKYVRVWATRAGTDYGMEIIELEVYGQRYTEDNIYDFTGQTGSSTAWATAANWTKGVVPSAEDTVRLLAPVVVPADNTVHVAKVIIATGGSTGSGNSLTIGGKLTIASGGALVVTDSIKRCADAADFSTLTVTRPADIKIESSIADGNGTLIFTNTGDSATVELCSKASTAAIPWTWQYIGIPFETADPLSSFYGGYLYEWPVGTDVWQSVTRNTTLTAFTGYSVSYPEANYKFVMDGKLAPTTDQDIEVPAGKYMVIGNSWTAPIYVKGFDTEDFGDIPTKSIYLFNTGSHTSGDETWAGSETRYNAGTYVCVPINAAGITGDSLIAPLQGFYVDNTLGTATTFTMKYDNLVRPEGSRNVIAGQLHAPRRVSEEEHPVVLKMWAGGTNYDDRLILMEREDFTSGYDAGWDGEKWDAPGAQPMLYTTREDGTTDAVSAIPELDGTIISFRAGEDDIYTLRFEYAEDNDDLYIFDTEARVTTQVVSGNTYTFYTGVDDNEAHQRFILTRSHSPQITTDVGNAGSEGDAKAVKFLNHDKLFIYRNGVLYDATGKRVQTGEVRMDSGEKGGAQ